MGLYVLVNYVLATIRDTRIGQELEARQRVRQLLTNHW